MPSAPSADDPVVVYHDGTRSRSAIAVERLAERLDAHADALRAGRARERELDVAALRPIEVESRDLATSEEEGALALSLLLPMLLIVMAVMGSFFPAVDLTAGEKERRTAETTLLLPIPPVVEQRGIVDHLEQAVAWLDKIKETAEQAIALLRERRAALISAAVTGKIDVRC